MLESTTISMGELETNNRVEGTELTIDSSTGALLTSYASCYTIALRIGAQQRGVDDLGEVVIDAEADRDTENDLEAIRFDILSVVTIYTVGRKRFKQKPPHGGGGFLKELTSGIITTVFA